jgi:transposase
MSVQLQEQWPIPEETQRVARAAFPDGNMYIRLRDDLGELYKDEQFVLLFAHEGQPAVSPGRLALITVMQFSEGLSDRQAADAVRSRIDWKYALGLELTDPGFHYSVLSEFRGRLVQGQQEGKLLDILLETIKQRGWLKARGRQRTDSTHVLAAVRRVNRLELVGETLRQALNELATVAPEWLQGVAKAEWFSRYGRRFDRMRFPKGQVEQEQWMETIGADGMVLLEAIRVAKRQGVLQHVRTVEVLRQVWVQQYWSEQGPDGLESVHLRHGDDQPPCEQRIQSPYDPEARYGAKNSTEWVGYKVHVTETCDEGVPHLITHVETTTAIEQDVDMAGTIHAALEAKALLPGEHLMDAGFIDAQVLVEAKRDLGVEVCGPVKKDSRWQAHAGQGYSLADFTLDWESKQAICPQGQRSRPWSEHRNTYGHEVIHIRFSKHTCAACPCRELCTRSKNGARSLLLRSRDQHEALQKNRQAQATQEFWQRYAKRSGIEGTISQGVCAFGMRRTRYIGLAKATLQNVALAAAMDLGRLYDWLEGVPCALTRVSRFARIAPNPSLVPTGWRA